MQASTFWKIVTVDRANLLERLLAFLGDHKVRYCVVGGQAVNAYAEPVVSLDLDIVIALDDLERVEPLLDAEFSTTRFPHSINLSLPGSDLRVQIQTDPRYAAFVAGATRRALLGVELPVARVEDVLQGKIWAIQDSRRPASKRQKDLADVARLLETHAHLRSRVPADVLEHLV
jgi:hypothetical protein